jgi:hypothetical protein
MEITRRYLAGFMDGEGYLGIMKMKNPSGYHYAPAIKIAQTSEPLLKELALKLGGHIGYRVHKHPNQSPSWTWDNKTWVQVEKVLDYVYPYLIIKRPQADILKEFLSTKTENNGSRGMSDKTRKRREELYRAIRVLNHRGVPPAETERESS